jgi:hypothetical protein
LTGLENIFGIGPYFTNLDGSMALVVDLPIECRGGFETAPYLKQSIPPKEEKLWLAMETTQVSRC